jgi:PAS domain S-box-containing protein
MRDLPRTASQDELYRLLVDNIRDYAVYVLDTGGNVVTWNAGAERIKGYTASEIVGQHFSVFYPHADRKLGRPERSLAIAAEAGRYEEHGWRMRKDGSQFWANVIITPLKDAAGDVRGFVKVTRDLTERKRAEDERAALQAVTEEALAHLDLRELLETLLDRIAMTLAVDTVAVLLLDEEDQVLVARAAKGLEEEVVRGVRIPFGRGFAGRIAAERRPIVLPDVDHADVLNPILRQKRIRSLLGVPLAVQGGKVIGVLHVGTLQPRAFGDDDVHFLQIVADRVALAIEHARLYEDARQARSDASAAEAALRARDEFLSVAAHELKTPMTSAKMAAQLLARSFRTKTLTTAQQRSLETIDRQITKLGRLVVRLLDTVRTQSGSLTMHLASADLVEVVRGVVDEASGLSDRHTITLDAPASLPMTADALRLEQVVLNLLENAVKFMPEGGPIEVSLAPAGRTAVLSVRDRGVGVAPEHLPRLFDRFYQAHSDRSGMGLGLYISRQIVEQHGGTIYAESPPDGGTRFVISLPVASRSASSAERASA